FEANLKLGEFAGVDPYVGADPVIDEYFNMFNQNSAPAPKINSSEVYQAYSSDLWDEKDKLIAAVARGEMTGEEAIAQYNEECGDIVAAILESFNN
ncbi:MAG: hypothetical protein K2O34_08310, partial [Acetatifactor sp.]|nr:hypothetical protein [Acetatifactor sp.]